jgi:hypothetical protein
MIGVPIEIKRQQYFFLTLLFFDKREKKESNVHAEQRTHLF